MTPLYLIAAAALAAVAARFVRSLRRGQRTVDAALAETAQPDTTHTPHDNGGNR